MELNKEDCDGLMGQRIVLRTKKGYTYNCIILSHGKDYIKIRDKYDKIWWIQLEDIETLEEL